MLVGRVPNPQSQVEQITIALIYKFMDDMDAEAEALGGKRSFFTAEFAKYGWSKLMAPGIGGFDMLNLYSEAIQKMNENPGVPALFRDIFKNAYLPHRDPETLRSFLKEINSFTYDHSERLGDAFEYLLSVLGSQGDAGQFRTPRHIIDFMVEIIDPKKDESILDPACGTAGFLISSYKHILKHNSKGYQEQQDRETYDEQGVPLELLTLDSPLHYRGDLLTPDDKKRLATNIRGYDISPDMVRLSLVNMYLHGFASPHIDEYDTLTSDEKWNELADVILANPPFMSPKGGIKPHKRFSITATRSEVLFVDYIAEHLTPNGRAAVIVPEGIIFQNGNAYKQLREMLVKQYLVAVISLPAGVFNPYSGVKTSILVLDKRLAKKTDAILFAKIENDGYHLGAQRRPIENNDLSAAVRNIKGWLDSVRNGTVFDVERIVNLNLVAKVKIVGNGEWNLNGERYRSNDVSQTTFDMVELGDTSIFSIESGGTPKSTEEAYWKGGIHWATLVDLPQGDFISQITKTERTISEAGLANSSAKVLPVDTVIVSSRATIGRVGIARITLATNQGFKNIVIKDTTRAIPEFVAYMIKKLAPDMEAMATGGTFKEISKSTFATLKIPLPSLEVQKAIVAEIEGYQKIIDGARQVVENYQPRIPIRPDWPMVELNEVCDVRSGGTPSRSVDAYWNGNIPWVTTTLVGFNIINDANEFITSEGLKESSTWIVPKGTVLMAMYGQGITRGKVAILGIDAAINQACAAFTIKSTALNPDYLFRILESKYEDLRRISDARGGNQSNLSAQVLKQYKIPLPDLDTQRAIVAQIETEQHLVNANKELIRIFEDKIKAVINRVWGETA
ncbi:N-6 DNA methylase [Nitrosomonas sp.]|uniref:N-6 DNA methylase n=1 Tax=Nitrosomonas sp. TaxID=42353 RepID=UPI0032ECB1E8